MKKLLFIVGTIAAVITISTTFASDRKESKRTEAAPTRSESPEPSCRRCGLWRICFSCCCKPKNVERALVSLDIIHAAIEVVLLGTPGAIREIYLLCQSAGYALSRVAVRILRDNGFLDKDGNIKEGWRDHILQLLAHDGTAANSQVFYFDQSIEDLVERYPEVARQLLIASAAHNVYIPAMLTTLLHDQYQLIAQPTKITLEELTTISTAITSARSASERATRSGLDSPPSRFRLRLVSDIASRRNLANSVIIN